LSTLCLSVLFSCAFYLSFCTVFNERIIDDDDDNDDDDDDDDDDGDDGDDDTAAQLTCVLKSTEHP